GGDEALRQRARDGHDLERRARFVRIGDGPVPLGVAIGLRGPVRVKAGLNGHCGNLAVRRIYADWCSSLRAPAANRLPEHRLGIRLQRVVDGEPDVFALDGRLGTDDVQGPTERVPKNDLPPVAPGERLVGGELAT